MGMAKRSFSRKLVHNGIDARMYQGDEAQFHVLESAEDQTDPPLSVLVQTDPANSMFFRYKGFGGEIAVMPQGKTEMP
jgi:hypothetical protein